jgi:sarcosine oxidase subunit gamma
VANQQRSESLAFGRQDTAPGLVARECGPCALATLMARRGQEAELSAAIAQRFHVELPTRPRVVHAGGVSFVWSGPGHWLVHAEGAPLALESRLIDAAGPAASVIDQSDSRVLLDLAGTRVRDVLAKGFAVDLDPAVFGDSDVAVGVIDHIGVQLWQVGPTPVYRVAIARSYHGSWWDWLVASTAEYGGVLLAGR